VKSKSTRKEVCAFRVTVLQVSVWRVKLKRYRKKKKENQEEQKLTLEEKLKNR
jgi:hypothetical protein